MGDGSLPVGGHDPALVDEAARPVVAGMMGESGHVPPDRVMRLESRQVLRTVVLDHRLVQGTGRHRTKGAQGVDPVGHAGPLDQHPQQWIGIEEVLRLVRLPFGERPTG